MCMFWYFKALWGLYGACMGSHIVSTGVVLVNFFIFKFNFQATWDYICACLGTLKPYGGCMGLYECYMGAYTASMG